MLLLSTEVEHFCITCVSCIINTQYYISFTCTLASLRCTDLMRYLDCRLRGLGVDDGALKWFESYLRGRTNVYSTESIISLPVALACGVLQGSVMGPMEFIA